MLRELPPTAGLPLSFADLISTRAPDDLATGLANLLGVPAVQVESSGTACLIIALAYLKTVSNRGKVVVSGYTCPLVAIAIAQAGLQVVVCDTQPDSYDFDWQKLAACVDEDTLAVIPTHIGGIPADVNACAQIARLAGAFIIEDAAQALGATYGGKPVGTIGDIGVFSLTRGKGLSIYEGGFLVAADPKIQQGLTDVSQQLSLDMASVESFRCLQLILFAWFYNPLGLALTYGPLFRAQLKRKQYDEAVGDVFPLVAPVTKVSAYRCRVGASALRRFPGFLAGNRARGRMIAGKIALIPGLKVLTEQTGDEASWPFITVIFDRAEDCARALDRLWMSGLGVSKLFTHSLPGYEYLSPLVDADRPAPNAEKLAARSLTITNTQWLSNRDIEHICSTLMDICSQAEAKNFPKQATL